MAVDNKKLIDDFIKETPNWIKSMSKINAEKQCPFCGLVPDNMLDPMPIGEEEQPEALKCEMCGLYYSDEKNRIHVDETGCCISCYNSIK